MHWPTAFFLATVTAVSVSPAGAAEKTLNLFIPEMTCASCPYIVKSAISKLDGVRTVEASLKTRTATVVYDDAKTSTKAVLKTTAALGYSATVIEPKS